MSGLLRHPRTHLLLRLLLGAFFVFASLDKIATDEGTVCFLELLPRGAAAVVAETIEVTEQGRGYFERVVDVRDFVALALLALVLACREARGTDN